ncbi:MAG TPA: hypothetical protein VMT99_03670 [Candidatus Paceibacterota bacterium]|nr:hypothetical protein [Candidatus Paceibacterota bacterium]
MPQIIENKVYHHGQKMGWIEGSHIRSADNQLLGYFDRTYVYDAMMHKIAYIENDALHFENGQPHVSLERINEEIEGTYPLNVKCAVHVLFEG